MLKNFVMVCIVLVVAVVAYHVLTEKGVDLCFTMNETEFCIN